MSERRAPLGLGTLVAILLAAALIGSGDRLLRRDENLLVVLKSQDAPVFLPFADYLRDQIATKTSWHTLQATLSDAAAKGNQKLFTSTSFEIAKFIALHMSSTDDRRRQVLSDLIARYGDSVDTIPAYSELLSLEWKPKLESQWPAYTRKILAISASPDAGMMAVDMSLASQLESDKEPELELLALRQVYKLHPVEARNIDAMKQLLALMGPSDPDRVGLQKSLATYQAWADQVTLDFEWFRKFQAAVSKDSIAAAEAERSAAPTSLLPSFVAAADASLALSYARTGRYEDADRLRRSLVTEDASDIEAVSWFIDSIVNPPTTMPTKRAATMTSIDQNLIQTQRWKGLLLLHRFADAASVAKTVFPATTKALHKGADDELATAQGRFTKLSPVLTLRLCTDNLPPEMPDATNVYAGTFNLPPTGKGIPANIHAHVDLWISSKLIVAQCTAEEPRKPLPPAKIKKQNGPVTQDEAFELSFNPDRWFDFDYQIAVNSAGVTSAFRVDAFGSKNQQHPVADLGLKASAAKTPTGWTVRLVMPRKLLVRPGGSFLRFNVRRLRYVQEHGQSIKQIYSWSPTANGDHQSDRWGWLIVPGSTENGSSEEFFD